ncbi:hypothetical protein RCL_jg6916.t1 [Rhizophagus clarus]|uniref:PiggyBac transposable element-derived protein domain-containing protein n=1 Tax=Rhizophagus clarus TaxID=94130 RepID=A0A8H3QLY4_9GLOM|nr:hypothetical protein RCL_jg6916.t1 [Rhizophagus clarus]
MQIKHANDNYDNINNNNNNNNKTVEIKENVRGRDRSRGRGRGKDSDSDRERGHGHSDNEQTVQLPSPSLFNKFQHFKFLHEFTIKHFLHVSDYTIASTFWYSKLDPLMTHIQAVSKSICIPSSNVLIDEIIVRFSGRSVYTVKIKIVNDILAILWMDNDPVTMLSTIHQINGDENQIEKVRRQL